MIALLLKPIIFLIAIVLVAIGFVWWISWTLGIDDLRSCQSVPTPQSSSCASADVIVAISGGDTSARTSEAVALYKQGWAPYIVFSGAAYDENSPSNAVVMQNQALKAGVPAEAILLEEESLDTATNAAQLKLIIEKQAWERILLVTSPYHQRRASMEFKRTLGPTVTVINHPTPHDRFWPPDSWWLTPIGWWLAFSELTKITYITVVPK